MRTYEIQASELIQYRASSTSNSYARRTGPETQGGITGYYAGATSNYRFGVYSTFDFSTIPDGENVESVEYRITRLEGGSVLSYTVSLYMSTPAVAPANNIQAGNATTSNYRDDISFTGISGQTEPYDLSFVPKKGTFANLRDYGLFIYYRNQNRTINVGNVTAIITTDGEEPEPPPPPPPTPPTPGRWSAQQAFYYDGEKWVKVRPAYYDGKKWDTALGVGIYGG